MALVSGVSEQYGSLVYGTVLPPFQQRVSLRVLRTACPFGQAVGKN